MRRFLAFLLALTVALPVVATADTVTDEGCFVNAISLERMRARVKALERVPRLDTIARDHSKEMAGRETIYHNPNVAQEIGSYSYAGENVGMGPDCETIHAAFMASTGHRENILDSDFRQLGVGVAHGSDDTVYVTEVFMTPRAASPAATPKEKPPCRCPK